MTNKRVLECSAHLKVLFGREREDMFVFLIALALFYRSSDWVEMGYRNLYEYLYRELRMTATMACFRNKAAELLLSFPQIEGPLRDGRLCITVLYEVAKVLEPKNADEVLPKFFRVSTRDAKAVV